MAWRDSRRSRRWLLLYSSSILLGVAALVAVGSFGESLSQSIETQAKALLGADLALVSREDTSDAEKEFMSSLGGVQAFEVSFSSMIAFPKTTQMRLVQIRALSGGFPFYGTLETDPSSAAATFRTNSGALVEDSLLQAYSAEVGDLIQVGKSQLKISGRLRKVPGETIAFGTIAPRVYIPFSLLEDTGLLKKGSLVRYKYYFKFDPEANVTELVKRIRPELEKYHLDSDTVEHRKRDLGRAMTNLYHFLNLVGFVSLLLGGIGIASAIHVHVKQKLPTVAILRFIGCRPGQAFAIYFAQAIGLALLGITGGLAVGLVAQFVLPKVLGDFIPFRFSTEISYAALGRGAGIGFIICLLFAMGPLLRVRRVAPLGVLRASVQQEVDGRRDYLLWICYGLIVVGLFAFSISQSQHWWFGISFGGGLCVAFAILAGVAQALAFVVKGQIGRVRRFTYRQGLANLYRPNNRTVLLMVCLGLGTFLILTLYLSQRNLIEHLLTTDQKNRSDAVLFDIQSDQKDGVVRLLQAEHFPILQQVPVVTMRLTSINGKDVEHIRKQPHRSIPNWALRREYRSTYRGELEDSEKLIAGTWHERVASGTSPVPVSLEDGIAKTLQVKLGDELIFDVQGLSISTVVASVREVDWRRLQPNFFVVFPLGVLEEAPSFHVLVTRVESSARSALMQREVTKQFPNVSIVDLTLVTQTIDGILKKISFVVRFMALFTVGTGLLVLVASVLTGRYQRLQESVLLRTLGASRGQIRQILFVEYLALGLLAALTGIILATAGSWGLSHYVFKIPFSFSAWPLVWTAGAVSAMTVLAGLGTSYGACTQPPLEILRKEL